MRREYGFTLVKVKHVSSGKTWIWKLAKKITKDPRVEKPGFVNSPPKKDNSEVLQSQGQQCRNETSEWNFVCSPGEETSVYVLENELEKSSC